MKRMHIVLRFLVLAAMMLSFGESVWASTCASMSIMAASAEMSEMPSMPGMPDMPDMPRDGQQGSEPWCPFGPAAAATGCVSAVLLPAPAALTLTGLSEREVRVTVTDAPQDLLYTATLFHPPRA